MNSDATIPAPQMPKTVKPAPTKGAKARKPQPVTAKVAKAATKQKPASKGTKAAGKMSGLDAAAKVLADAREPMRCVDMVALVLKKGLWKSSGKTPAATIHAAIIREINGKKADSRFKKTGRGMFSAKR